MKVSLISSQNILNGIGSSSLFGVLTKKNMSNIDTKQKIGMEKKGINQKNPAKKDPKIGLNTFPRVLDVSISPNELLTSSSVLNISPTRGMTIGKAPAAPTPWKSPAN